MANPMLKKIMTMSFGPSIRLRKKILPKTFADFSAFIFMSCAIPTVYWFEVFVVLPTLFGWPLYIFHAVVGTYILLNIIGNFVSIMLVDTSTQGLLLPSQVPQGWHVCVECEGVAPPRARHCNICNTCILKREHHCVFTGCCVGLSNHRYFYVFLVYMWGATFYCSGLNALFIWPHVGGLSWWAAVRLLIPGVWLLWSPSLDTLYAFLFSINVIGCLFMSVLVYYYTGLLYSNITTTEKHNGSASNKYDHGRDHNIKVSLGNHWYKTWIFPSVKSPLPYDGLDWSLHNAMRSTRPKTK